MCICAIPPTPIEGVTVYGRREAGDFQAVRRFFEDRGVLFDQADVGADTANLERMAALSGQTDNVVVEVGKRVLVGFDSDALESVLP